MSEQKLTRAEEIAAGRRRRSPSANINGMFLRLGVDPATKDPNYEYRWINDDKGRLQAMTQQDDWDFVANREVASDDRNMNETETRIRRVVDKTASGEPMYAYWCRKYKPWYDEDLHHQTKLVQEKRKAMIQNMHDGSPGTASDDPQHIYIPAEAKNAIAATEARENRIRRSQKG